MIYLSIYFAMYILIFILDIMPLVKARRKKTLLVYLPVFFFTLAVNVIFGLGKRVPSPAVPIKNAVDRIFGLG